MPAEIFAPFLALALSVPSVCTSQNQVVARVVVEHHPPSIRSNYTMGEIRGLAASSGRPLKHKPLGFYAGTFGYVIDSELREMDAAACKSQVNLVTIRLMLDKRLIEVGKDVPCRSSLVIDHYQRHALQDDKLLSLYGERIRAALDQTTAQNPYQQDDDVSQSTSEAGIRRIIDKQLKSYDQDRAHALDGVDTEAAIKELELSCSKRL